MKMLFVRLFFVFAAVTLFAPAQAVHAQGLPTTLSVGAYFPGSGPAKQYGGSSQVYVDARYGFPVSVPLTPTRTVISVAGEFGGHGGGHSTIVPITIGEYLGASGRSPFAAKNIYAGIGIGGYVEDISRTSNALRFGGYGTVGYNFGLGFFVDAKYQFVEHGNGGLVGVGFRF